MFASSAVIFQWTYVNAFTSTVAMPLTCFCITTDWLINCSCFLIFFKKNKCKHQGCDSFSKGFLHPHLFLWNFLQLDVLRCII